MTDAVIKEFRRLDPPQRLLMGPGPSQVPPRVLAALGAPTVGHLDPYFLSLMDDIQTLLRGVFRTRNALTFAVSGTGSAGMEACLANVLEPGDHVLVAQNGVFGGRMREIAERLRCSTELVEAPFGRAIEAEQVAAALAKRPAKLVCIVHGETSTGVLQPLADITRIARDEGALVLADCVTSLGGVPVEIDGWGIDIAYAGTQKCLSCPPGLSPVTFSARAVEVIERRKSKVASWYLDARMLLRYWGSERVYHHTAPINMLYGLREALVLLEEEGLDQVFERHALHHRALVAGLEAMGLRLLVEPRHRLPQLNAVRVPEGINEAAVRGLLLHDYGIEIGGGLGPLKGEVWRIGLMGHTARRANIALLLSGLESCLAELSVPIARGAALSAAASVWSEA